MEGVMNTAQLNSFLFQKALKGSSVEEPGKIYLALCRVFPLRKVRSKRDHSLALNILTKLSGSLREIKMSSKDRRQILDYMDALGLLVEEYEKKHFAVDLYGISGRETLEFLMEQHDLRQMDLAKELGGQSIVSEILSGKRVLNSHQILVLSKRFGVSPAVFFP